jgi:hypothetical protein
MGAKFSIMKLSWCATCRAMQAILATSITLALPAMVRAAAEEYQPPVTGDAARVTPAQADGAAGTKSAEERVAELEARVATLERELRQLRTATQSAAAALASAARGGDGPVIGSSGGGSASSSAGTPAPRPAASDHNIVTLSEESKKEFLTEMRAMAEQLSNATPDERADAVRELMARLRARDEAMKNPGGSSSSGNSININIGGNSNPTDVPPQPPTVSKAPVGTPPPPAATERMGSLHDPTRQRFEALNVEQRNRFVREMRNMREKMQYATPEERSVLVQEVLTRVEKETPKPSTTPAASTPAPAEPSRE